MATETQSKANQKNAKKSTGPKTLDLVNTTQQGAKIDILISHKIS
jgi:hypothetical protein